MLDHKLKSSILRQRTKQGIKKVLLDTFENSRMRIPKKCDVKVLILCNPCNGFGDVIFASKIWKYIIEWYQCNTKIATPVPGLFVKLGFNQDDLIDLDPVKVKQCRKFGYFDKRLTDFDLILVAPLAADFPVSFSDVKALVPNSSIFNTFFFSEYNDALNKGFDFNTGVGGERDGLLLVKTKTKKSDITEFKLGKYFVAYIANIDDTSMDCFAKFISMITEKYNGKISLVTPKWIEKIPIEIIKRHVKGWNVTLTTNTENRQILHADNARNHLYIRADVLPVANSIMLSLMKYSQQDILLTGDQSITDCLSCCPNKNIFYQIAGWKTNFAMNLAKYMPNKYLKSYKTSCGTHKAISYVSNYDAFVRDWDFRIEGKYKLDGVMRMIHYIQKSEYFSEMIKVIEKSRTMDSMKNKIHKILV